MQKASLQKALQISLNQKQFLQMQMRLITVKNKEKSIADQFIGSIKNGWNKYNLIDYSQEKMNVYKGEFNEYARPFDRYMDENRFKDLKR